MNKNRRTRLIVAVVLIVFMCCCCAAPLPLPCGAPGFVCRTGYVEGRGSMVFYEVEPVGIAALESLLGDNLPLYYYRWESWDE